MWWILFILYGAGIYGLYTLNISVCENGDSILRSLLVWGILGMIWTWRNIDVKKLKNKFLGSIMHLAISSTLTLGFLLIEVEKCKVFRERLGHDVITKDTRMQVASILILLGPVIIAFIHLICSNIVIKTLRKKEKKQEEAIKKQEEAIKKQEENIKAQREEEERKKKEQELEHILKHIVNKGYIEDLNVKENDEFYDEISYYYDENLNLKSINKKPKYTFVGNDGKVTYLKNCINHVNNIKLDEEYTKNNIDEPIKNKDIIRFNYKKYIDDYNLDYFMKNLTKNEKTNKYLEFCCKKKDEFSKYIDSRARYINHEYKSMVVGERGEEEINKELDLYENIYNLKGVRIEVLDNNGETQSIENDNIIISKNGIFVVEVKNFGVISNFKIIVERDGRWIKKRYGKTEVMKSVAKQNNRHIAYLEKFINKSLNRNIDDYIEVNGIIAIGNDILDVENYSENQKIFRSSEIYPYIKSQEKQLTMSEMQVIKELLEEANLGGKKYIVYDYSEELEDNIRRFHDFKKESLINLEKLNNFLEYEIQ